METISHLEHGLVFGKLADTPNIQYIIVIDLNQSILLVPCTSLDISVANFIQSYLQTTTCKNKEQKPVLRIEQGLKKGNYAHNDEIVAGFGFDLKKSCFRVEVSKKTYQKQVQRRRLEQDNQLNQRFRQRETIQINVRVIGLMEQFKLVTNPNQKIKDLKKKAIQEISFLKKRTIDQLEIRHNDIRLSNDNQTLSKYQVAHNSNLLIKFKQQGGCFSPDTLVTLANQQSIKIKDIKIGDQLLSYNKQKGIFQKDRVSFVKLSRVQQCLTVVFENETEIKTTANHFFLCQDGEFRCFTTDLNRPDSSKSLKIGMNLITQKSLKRIKHMQCSQVNFNQNEFYHLSIQKNHTFIVNNVITHNMFIKIKLAQGEQKVDVSPSSLIIEIKQKLEELYFIQAYNQRLIYSGKQLHNNTTIAQNNIPKEATLHLIKKSTEFFNLIKEESLVMLADNSLVQARQLQQGTSLRVYDPKAQQKGTSDMIQLIEEVEMRDYMYVGLGQYEKTIGLSADTYVQLANGEAANVRDICYILGEKAELRGIDGSTVNVKGIAHIEEQTRPKNFFRISMLESKNFVARNIIIHNKVINLLIMKDEQRLRKVSFGVVKGQKIGSILQKLQVLTKVAAKHIILLFNEHQLDPDRTLQEYDLQTYHLVLAIVQTSISKISKSSILMQAELQYQNIEDKIITVQVSDTQKEIIYYYKDKQKTIQTIIGELLPNYSGSYFFTFDNLILFPSDTLQKLEFSPNFKLSENTIILVKNQKLSFINAMDICKEDVGNYSGIKRKGRERDINSVIGSGIEKINEFSMRKEVKAACSRIQKDQNIQDPEFKQEAFFLPFLYLTCREYSEKIKKLIMGIEIYKKQPENQDLLSIIRDAYINMQQLPNCYGKCYLGLSNFKFSRFFQKNQTFYLHSFTIAFQDEKAIKYELKNTKGTLFHITSLNGREVQKFSMFPLDKEILFAPFTPFFIEEIIQGQFYDEVYLVELSAPITFQKDIILWVDDQPQNNIREIKTILKTLDIEILQATSTLEAEKWIIQFGWLLSWKGLQFKIVTDMTRYEGIVREGYERKANYNAGIDLLKILYNKHGFNVKTLIYCGNELKAKQAALNAQLRNDRSYEITRNRATMLSFFEIKKN